MSEFSKQAFSFLKECNVNVSHSFIAERMETHPDYPALTSFTDTLDELGIVFEAIVADKDEYKGLSYPALIHFVSDRKADFAIINESWQFTVDDNKMLNDWTGIAVSIARGSVVELTEHNVQHKKERQGSILKAMLAFLMLVVALIPVFRHSLLVSCFQLLNLTGIQCCGAIMLLANGRSTFLSGLLCDTSKDSGCAKVARRENKGWLKNIDLGFIGLLYFTTNFIYLGARTAIDTGIEDIWATNRLLASMSVPVIFFSIIYQGKVEKKWCRLCLLADGVLLLQAVIATITFGAGRPFLPSLSTTILFVSALLLALIISLFFSRILVLETFQRRKSRALLKWQRNPELFIPYLLSQRRVDTSPLAGEIVLGNSKAGINLLVICQPFCQPCAEAHKYIQELLCLYRDELCVTVRFLVVPNANKSFQGNPLLEILSGIDQTGDAEHVLHDWFDLLDSKAFKRKYPMEEIENLDFFAYCRNCFEWCKEAKITHTPTLFVNGYEYSEPYSYETLKLLFKPAAEKLNSVGFLNSYVSGRLADTEVESTMN
ncbi:MAG: thioredoxin domain-containing protein [Chitinophagaceae bacterium]|nr:thioredoxin domain-containing protein [Chitinophagaceae bacterium]